jgi:hypothetical protein
MPESGPNGSNEAIDISRICEEKQLQRVYKENVKEYSLNVNEESWNHEKCVKFWCR